MSDETAVKKQGIPWVNDWAKFRATDEDGKIFEFESRPSLHKDDGVWDSHGRMSQVYPVPGWESSLEERES